MEMDMRQTFPLLSAPLLLFVIGRADGLPNDVEFGSVRADLVSKVQKEMDLLARLERPHKENLARTVRPSPFCGCEEARVNS